MFPKLINVQDNSLYGFQSFVIEAVNNGFVLDKNKKNLLVIRVSSGENITKLYEFPFDLDDTNNTNYLKDLWFKIRYKILKEDFSHYDPNSIRTIFWFKKID